MMLYSCSVRFILYRVGEQCYYWLKQEDSHVVEILFVVWKKLQKGDIPLMRLDIPFTQRRTTGKR